MHKFYLTKFWHLQTDGHDMKVLHLICIACTQRHMHYALHITWSRCISQYCTQTLFTEDVLMLRSSFGSRVDDDHDARMHAHQGHVTAAMQII